MKQEDIVSIIVQTINTIFSNLFSSLDNSIYGSIDKLIFINSDIIENSIFEKLLGSSGRSSLIYLADAMLLGVSMFYIVRYYYLNVIDIKVEKPRQFIFKLLIFTFMINFSYFLVEQLLYLVNIFSSSIQEIGKEIIGLDISFSELIITLNKKLASSSPDFNVFSLDGIIKSFVSFGLVNLLLSYSLRYILLQVLILFSPFAILCLINSSTSWIFSVWFKSVFSLLIIQIFVPLVLIVILSIDNNNKLLYVGGIYCLSKMNEYIREMFGGIGINVSSNISSMVSVLK